MATGKTDLQIALLLIDVRLDECKRFASVLQRSHRLNGALGLHYDNRCQALELERDRLTKLIAKESHTKQLKNS